MRVEPHQDRRGVQASPLQLSANDASIGYGHLVEHAFEHLVTLTQGQYDALGRSVC